MRPRISEVKEQGNIKHKIKFKAPTSKQGQLSHYCHRNLSHNLTVSVAAGLEGTAHQNFIHQSEIVYYWNKAIASSNSIRRGTKLSQEDDSSAGTSLLLVLPLARMQNLEATKKNAKPSRLTPTSEISAKSTGRKITKLLSLSLLLKQIEQEKPWTRKQELTSLGEECNWQRCESWPLKTKASTQDT